MAALGFNNDLKIENLLLREFFPTEGGHGGPPLQYVPRFENNFGTELRHVRVTVWIYPSRVSPTGVSYAPTLRRNRVESFF